MTKIWFPFWNSLHLRPFKGVIWISGVMGGWYLLVFSSRIAESLDFFHLISYMSFFGGGIGLGSELRTSRLQSKHSTTWATPLVHFALVILEMGSHQLSVWAGLELWSSQILPHKQLGLQAWATSTLQNKPFFFWWYWGLNSGLCACRAGSCKAGVLSLEPQFQSLHAIFLIWIMLLTLSGVLTRIWLSQSFVGQFQGHCTRETFVGLSSGGKGLPLPLGFLSCSP
jgi:hypothetical protein